MKSRARRRAERQGFEDALVSGFRDPTIQTDHEEVAYNRGFDRGMQAVRRLTADPDDRPIPSESNGEAT